MIHKIPFYVDYNFWLKCLDTQLIESTNKKLLKVPKVVKPTNRKTLLVTVGTSVINSPLSPFFLTMLSYHEEKKSFSEDSP